MAREIDEAWIHEAVERYRRIESLQAEFEQAVHGVEVTVRSPDDLVQVVVTAGGAIREVTIVGPLHNRTSAELSRSVQAAVAAAADAARWASRKLHEETFSDYHVLRER